MMKGSHPFLTMKFYAYFIIYSEFELKWNVTFYTRHKIASNLHISLAIMGQYIDFNSNILYVENI